MCVYADAAGLFLWMGGFFAEFFPVLRKKRTTSNENDDVERRETPVEAAQTFLGSGLGGWDRQGRRDLFSGLAVGVMTLTKAGGPFLQPLKDYG